MAAQAKPGVQERILLHLLDYSDFKDSIEAVSYTHLTLPTKA